MPKVRGGSGRHRVRGRGAQAGIAGLWYTGSGGADSDPRPRAALAVPRPSPYLEIGARRLVRCVPIQMNVTGSLDVGFA